jgi:hypothetical protein
VLRTRRDDCPASLMFWQSHLLGLLACVASRCWLRFLCDRRRRLGAKSAERILSLRFIADMSDSSSPNHYTAGPSRSRRVPLGLVVLVLVAIGGAVFWGNSRLEKESSRATAVQPEAAQPSPAPQNDTKQAVTALEQAVKDLQSANQRTADQITDLQRQLSAEEGDRKLLSDQVGALSARLNDLDKARAEMRAPTRRRGVR